MNRLSKWKLTRKHTILAAVTGILATTGILVGVSLPPAPPVESPSPISVNDGERPATATPTPAPEVTPDPAPAVPEKLTQADLATLPRIYYDALVPDLLDASDDISPEVQWKVAQTVEPLTAIYAEQSADAKPVGYVEDTTVESRTALPVYGIDGDWLLVGTPGRNATPSANGGHAAAATFGWVRAADFELQDIERIIEVNVAERTLAIVAENGTTPAFERDLTLGSDEAPTPSAGTITYTSAVYTDIEAQPWTGGEPIALLGSHSERMDTYGGNSALTGIHYSTSGTSTSKGCVRVSAEMARLVGALPIGTPVVFV